jgi:capsular polysaccharide biosynthesis protein
VARVLAGLDAQNGALPSRIFLSRRDTRVLENEAEVADWLGARGFTKLYPEDFSAADQLRLFRQAEVIVAVHGAGLAPLLYASVSDRPRHLVELLPCGHMTDVYRVMAHQTGWSWAGVRGRLKPEYVKPAYAFHAEFKQFSLDSFEVDIRALDEAFALAGL